MTSPLRLEPLAFIRRGIIYGENREPFLYRVAGLPGDHEVMLGADKKWQIRSTEGCMVSDWTGAYESADDALAALQESSRN